MKDSKKKAATKKTLLERAIYAIKDGIEENIDGESYRLKVPDASTLDPERFNRIELSCDHQDVTISVFHGQGAVEKEVPEYDVTKPIEGQEIPLALRVLDSFAAGNGPFTKEDATRMAADIRKTFMVLSAPAQPKPAAMDELLGPVAVAAERGRTAAMIFESDNRISNPKLHALYRGYALETILIAKRACDQLGDLSRWPASDFAYTLWSKVTEETFKSAAWFEAMALIASRVDLTPYLPEGVSEAVLEIEA